MCSSRTSLSSSEIVRGLPDAYRFYAPVPCAVDIVLGTGEITLRTCLALQPGSIIGLDQSAGQDLTLVVNGVTFGRGEVVIIDETVSLRVTELARPESGL